MWIRFLAITFVFLAPSSALANWTMNVGYHNPVGSTVGLNLLYLGSHWAFEAGAGWVDIENDVKDKDKDDDIDEDDLTDNDDDDDDDSLAVGGDFDIKYRFRSGFFRPYLQAGIGWGASQSIGEVDAAKSVGGPFGGAGIFLGGESFHVYGSIIVNRILHRGVQAGVGWDI